MKSKAVLLGSALLAAAIAQQPRTISAALQPFVDQHDLAGAVTLIASQRQVLDVETVGYADIAARKRMHRDTIFWIASMSKPITTAAFMMLVDEGKVNVDEPVEKYLPEFKNQWLQVEQDNDHILLKHPSHPITVKNVLTHTSGMLPTLPNEKPTLDLLPLSNAVRSYAMTPLVFDPGTQYRYANAGINIAGRIIEVLSGMPYETFLQTRLFDPLGMKDTTFWPTEAQVQRLAKSYKANTRERSLEETPVNQLYYPLTDHHIRHPMPAGGLFSTADDLTRFCQMILAGGAFSGKRLLSEAAVKQATSVETGDIKINGNDGMGYGFGWSVLKQPAGDGRSAGSFGHGGAYQTAMWIDPPKDRIFILLRHQSGDTLTPEGKRIEALFYKTAIATVHN
jgi:CubicO group peptidase (beta-lactamase class C family)